MLPCGLAYLDAACHLVKPPVDRVDVAAGQAEAGRDLHEQRGAISGGAFSRPVAAAGDRDVRIAGGGATILEYVNAGLIDEFSIALSPVLFGSGIRLFEGVDAGRVALEQVRAEPTQRVTHLTYAVRER